MTADPSPAPSILRWALAPLVALLGAWILWNASIGINWPLWIAAASVAMLATAHRRYGSAHATSIVAASWAVIIAGGAAVTTAPAWIALLVPGSLLFFAISLAVVGRPSLDALRPRLAILAPFTAIASVLAGLIAEVADRAGVNRTARGDAIARSALITLPVIVVLVLLLADADPLFAALRSGLEALVPIDDPARIAFFLFLLALSAGVLGSISRDKIEVFETPAFDGLPIGSLEGRVLTAAMAAVMWLFVVSATISLLKNPAAQAGSGVTYAEYAHRGFAELNVAATLVIGAILVTRRTWARDDALQWRTAAAAIAGVGAMLIIAFTRVARYEQAYGFTYQRMQAQSYMLVLGWALILLSIEVMRRAPSGRFAYHVVTATLAIAMASVYYNTDAWIVRRNLELYRATGKLDIDYLTTQLSGDAAPALVSSVALLRDPERTKLDSVMRARASKSAEPDHRWYTWNLRRRQKEDALKLLNAPRH
jgi:two-component system sensor histidine kinase BaeS